MAIEINRCPYFEEDFFQIGENLYKKECRCKGTKEKEICTCEGDEKKCNFYKETKKKKSCPCCGCQPVLKANTVSISCESTRYYVQCLNCGLRTAMFLSQYFAIESWNRRTEINQ